MVKPILNFQFSSIFIFFCNCAGFSLNGVTPTIWTQWEWKEEDEKELEPVMIDQL